MENLSDHSTPTTPIKKKRKRTGYWLKRAGFDLTTYDRSTGRYSPRCSQCEVLVINGVATHEMGCPGARR